MAVAQRKKSKSKSRSRRAHTMKVRLAQLIECPQCGALKRSHYVCSKCGYYKNTLVYTPKFKSTS